MEPANYEVFVCNKQLEERKKRRKEEIIELQMERIKNMKEVDIRLTNLSDICK